MFGAIMRVLGLMRANIPTPKATPWLMVAVPPQHAAFTSLRNLAFTAFGFTVTIFVWRTNRICPSGTNVDNPSISKSLLTPNLRITRANVHSGRPGNC